MNANVSHTDPAQSGHCAMRARSLAPILPRLGMADMLTCATTLFGLCRRRDVSYGLEGRLHCEFAICAFAYSVERALRNTVLTMAMCRLLRLATMRYRNGTGAGAGAGAESVGIHQGNSYSCTARSRVLELVLHS